MRVWISGGGTGGHVYPALAVVEALAGQGAPAAQNVDICYIGSAGGMEEELVRREAPGIAFEAIPAGGLHGLAPWTMARNLIRLAGGFWRAVRLAGSWKPEALFVTGGFVSVPAALACWVRQVPILLYLPDIEPGWAEQFLSRLATRIGVTAEASRAFFPGRAVTVTGYPVRGELARARERRAEAQEHFGLDPARKTILILGGSRGARSLNRALGTMLGQVLARWQVIHISGTLDANEARSQRQGLDTGLQERYNLYPYLHSAEMGLALAAADLVISRAGASILGELPLMGLPGILVPYPFAWRYQKVNADYLVDRGAAVRLDNDRLEKELWPMITSILEDEDRWMGMRAHARSLARPDAANTLAAQLLALARRPAPASGASGAGRRAV